MIAVPPGRIPPHDLDAERCVLGGILLDGTQIDDVVAILRPEDFYREAHRKIYEAAISLVEKREPIDRVTVKDALKSQGALEAVGGESFVDLLDTVVPSAANLAYYAAIVHDKAQARRLIEAAHAIASQGYEQAGDVGEYLDESERRILAVREQASSASEPLDGRAVMKLTIKQIERDYERQEAVTGIPTGIEQLDAMTSGFQPGELIILAARPGQGKTTAGENWATHVALDVRRGVFAIWMEMPAEQMGKRQLASRARIDLQRLKRGRLLEIDWPRQAKVAGEIAAAPLLQDFGRNLSALEIRAKARRAKRKWEATSTPLGLVVVDYLTLMAEDPNADTKSIAVGKNAKALKDLAGDLGVPVLCLAQLNRQSAGGKPRRPVLSDLRDSGEIEQHADTVIFLHHEQDKDDERPETVEIIVEKQRNGPTGTVPASHLWAFCKIETGQSRYEYPRGGDQ